MSPQPRPLTERILGRLPGPRAGWIAAWALVPWLNAGANVLLDTGGTSAIWEQSRTLILLNYAALSVALAITLWGTGRIARRVPDLEALAAGVLERAPREPFRDLSSVRGPLLASVATAVLFAAGAFERDGAVAAALRGTTWIVLGIAFWTFLWTYASLQLGLDRLGRGRLREDVAVRDPGLGLRPLGGVAFMGLWMLLAWLVPVLLTGIPDVAGVAVGVLVLAGGLTAFVASLARLHRRMVELKARELAVARELYAQAYEPLRAAPTLAALEERQRLLAAADLLEQRARALHAWPVDEGTLARVITIATSVIAVIVARLILDPFGL